MTIQFRGLIAAKMPRARVRGMPFALMIAYVIGVIPSLGQSLLETHAHRQTQTAYTAVLYARDGIDLLRPPLPILGPPGDLPQEFPIAQAVGALLIQTGIGPDMAMRLVGLAGFLATAAFLVLIARRVMGPLGTLVALAAFLFNAHAWVYGRTSLIEYIATAGALGFLYFGIRWMEGGSPMHWLGAAAAGTLGIVVKITTGGFYLLPILLWRRPSGRWGFQQPAVWALLAVCVVIGAAWSAYAQAVREETPAAAFLSLENQLAWFFGSSWMRFDLAAWRVPLVAFISLTGFGLLLWAPLAVRRASAHPNRAFLLCLLALSLAIPLLLFNLYAIHDYYFAAIAPILALGIGLGAEWLQGRWHTRAARRAAVILGGAWIATIVGMTSSWSIIYGTPGEEAGAMRISDFVRDNSQPDDWVALRGWGWNSTFLYYARRQGIAIPEPVEGGPVVGGQDLSDIDLDEILADPVFGPFIACDHQANCRVEEE